MGTDSEHYVTNKNDAMDGRDSILIFSMKC